jgi:hypothetical protein
METRIFEKLEKLDEKLNSIDKTLERNTVSLEYHVMRTNQNEELIKALKSDLLPVENHVKYMQGAFKLLGVLTVIVSLIVGFTKLIFFKS